MDSWTILQGIQITAEKVAKKVKKSAECCCARTKQIGPALLQQLSTEVTTILTIIFLKSLSIREVPADWKSEDTRQICYKCIKYCKAVTTLKWTSALRWLWMAAKEPGKQLACSI
jgi:hypothetical protein